MLKKLCGVVAVFAAMTTIASANLLVNPGFEAPDASGGDVNYADGWWQFNDPNLSFVTQAEAHTGAQSLKMFGPWDPWGGVGMGQTFPASEGETWTANVWSLNSTLDPMQGDNFCVMKIEFLDAGGGPAGGSWLAGINVFEVTVATANSPLDEWVEFGLGTAPAPAGTASANFVLVEVQGGDTGIEGGSVFLDDAVFVPEPASLAVLAIGGLFVLRRRR